MGKVLLRKNWQARSFDQTEAMTPLKKARQMVAIAKQKKKLGIIISDKSPELIALNEALSVYEDPETFSDKTVEFYKKVAIELITMQWKSRYSTIRTGI